MVRNLRYADDTTIIVGTKLIEIMERVRKTSKETSLYRNVLNTKVNTTGYIEDVTVDGKMVDVVTIFIFPGALIIRDGLCDKEIRRELQWEKLLILLAAPTWLYVSLRQTQFSPSKFCHGPRLLSFRWLSCLG